MPVPHRPSSSRAAGLVGLLLIFAVVAAACADDGGGEASDPVDRPEVTVEVERRDLLTFSTVGGTLGFELTVEVVIPRDGTVTSVVSVGTVLDAGDVLMTIDLEPVVVLEGNVVMWRDLAEDVAPGSDIRQLEENLAAFGLDAGGDLIIDDVYDTATVTAVESWQETIGAEVDGEVLREDFVLFPGSTQLGEIGVVVGDEVKAGAILASATVLAAQQSIVHRRFVDGDGVLTDVAAIGTEVVDGLVLYAVGGRPGGAGVDAESAPVVTFDRVITGGVDPGADVALLEAFLVGIGFDAGGTLVVDRNVDVATLIAVQDWQLSLGFEPDEVPVVQVGDLVVVRGERDVASVEQPGGATVADGVVLTVARGAQVISGELPVADLDLLTVGLDVEVELPDGTVVPGVVVEVGDIARQSSGQGAVAVVDYRIAVDTSATDTVLVSAPVTVVVLEEAVRGVVAIPVNALVALAEGGYAIELPASPVNRLVQVELGAFADGWVEVTNGAVEPGELVVVAS